MNKHDCQYYDLMMLSGNDEDFVTCMTCGKEFTTEEVDKLKEISDSQTIEEHVRGEVIADERLEYERDEAGSEAKDFIK